MKEKKVIAVIPARGGSKGLPGKNIKELVGKPLISWTIEKALQSKMITKVMVTTDSEEIAEVSKKAGAEVPFLRPPELSNDVAGSVDVVNHVIDYYESIGECYDYIALLEPTSPLREDDDLDNMLIKLLKDETKKFDSIVSIGQVETHPSILKVKNGSALASFDQDLQMSARRQDMSEVYFPFGVAYIVSVKAFKKKQTFYTENSMYYEIKRYQCYEVDDIYDFLAIENVMRYEWKLQN